MQVRIEGGRVIGPNHHGGKTVEDALSGPVGIHVTGNNGGVHVQVFGHVLLQAAYSTSIVTITITYFALKCCTRFEFNCIDCVC